MQEDFEASEQMFKTRISELLSEISKQKNLIYDLQNQIKSDSTYKINPEHEKNLKFLNETNELLQQRVQAAELEKIKTIQKFKEERKINADELAKILLANYSLHGDQREKIEENLCRLWIAHENIFSDVLQRMFGKDYNGFLLNMHKKIEGLKKEVCEWKQCLKNCGLELRTEEKRENFKDPLRVKKFSNSLTQESSKFVFSGAPQSMHKGRKSLIDKQQNPVLENLATFNTEPDHLRKPSQNTISSSDFIFFLQCSSSALENCLSYPT